MVFIRRNTFGPLVAASLLAACAMASPPDPGVTPPPGAKGVEPPPHDVPQLEALLPDEIAGYMMSKSSHLPGPQEVYFVELASSVGKRLGDVSWAHATTMAGPALVIEATRVAGSDGARIRDFAVAESNLERPPAQELIAGKQVLTLPDPLGGLTYLYAAGDVSYVVRGDPDLAVDAVAALP